MTERLVHVSENIFGNSLVFVRNSRKVSKKTEKQGGEDKMCRFCLFAKRHVSSVAVFKSLVQTVMTPRFVATA